MSNLHRMMLRAAGTQLGGEFSPLDITWHTAFWAEDPNWTDPGDGNAVSQWDDASGNGRHATQTTSGDQPTYRASEVEFNSKPAVSGDVSDFMTTAAFTSLSQPNTLVVVGRTRATSGNRGFVGGITSTDRHLIYRTSGDNFTAFAGSNLTDGTADNDTHLFIAEFDGASSTFDVDGTQVSGDAGSQSVTGLTLFAFYDGTLQLDGLLAFVGLLDGTLTATEESDLKTWASDHYGITIS